MQVKKQLVSVLSRLLPRNTASIMPALRGLLMQLLMQVQGSSETKLVVESMQMIESVVRAAKICIAPYVRPTMRIITPQLSSPQPRIAVCALEVVRAIGEVCGAVLEPATLVPLIIESLGDHRQDKRQLALNTLGVVIQSAGYVVQPLFEQPKLLDLLLSSLSTSQPWSVRTEAIKVFGIIGAVEPLAYKLDRREIEAKGDVPVPADTVTVQWKRSTESVDGLDAEEIELLANIGPSNEEYYPSVAVVTVRQVLRDPGLSKQHHALSQAMKSLRFIFQSLGAKSQRYLNLTMPVIYSLVSNSAPEIQQLLVVEIHEIASIVKRHIRPYVATLMWLVLEFWSAPLLLPHLVMLVKQLAQSLQLDFAPEMARLLPQLLELLEPSSFDSKDGGVAAQESLNVLAAYSRHLGDSLFRVIPVLVDLFGCHRVAPSLCTRAVELVNELCLQMPLLSFASQILHPLMSLIGEHDRGLQTAALELLVNLVYTLGPRFKVFHGSCTRALQKHQIVHPPFETAVMKLEQHEWLADMRCKALQALKPTANASSAVPHGKLQRVNQANLRKAWDTSGCSSAEDWQYW